MNIIVLCGPESSGKSWLAAALAERFGAVVVSEYVRQFIEEHQRDTGYADIDTIARGQLAAEDAARALSPALLVLDTHLLSNILWSKELFGDCPAWIEPALLARHYDLHLLLSPAEVPWVADGQRCQPDLAERAVFFARSEQWLRKHRQAYQVIGGDWATRREQVFRAVQRLI